MPIPACVKGTNGTNQVDLPGLCGVRAHCPGCHDKGSDVAWSCPPSTPPHPCWLPDMPPSSALHGFCCSWIVARLWTDPRRTAGQKHSHTKAAKVSIICGGNVMECVAQASKVKMSSHFLTLQRVLSCFTASAIHNAAPAAPLTWLRSLNNRAAAIALEQAVVLLALQSFANRSADGLAWAIWGLPPVPSGGPCLTCP